MSMLRQARERLGDAEMLAGHVIRSQDAQHAGSTAPAELLRVSVAREVIENEAARISRISLDLASALDRVTLAGEELARVVFSWSDLPAEQRDVLVRAGVCVCRAIRHSCLRRGPAWAGSGEPEQQAGAAPCSAPAAPPAGGDAETPQIPSPADPHGRSAAPHGVTTTAKGAGYGHAAPQGQGPGSVLGGRLDVVG